MKVNGFSVKATGSVNCVAVFSSAGNFYLENKMNRQEFMKVIAGSMFAVITIPSLVNADQKSINRKNADVEGIKGFERGYISCLCEIRRQTKFSPKKCLEYDGVMYIAGIRGRVL